MQNESPPPEGEVDHTANTISVRETVHDLRNPLNVAKQYLRLARETPNEEYFDQIDTALERIDGIITTQLETVQQNTDPSDVKWVSFPLYVDQAWKLAVTHNAELETEFPVVDPPEIHVHPSHLQSMLENLFRNAAEHGGTDVTVRVGLLPDRTGFYIADNGVGIPPSDRDVIFNPGYSTDTNGTGLGLQIVETLTKQYDWTVTVTESKSGGARFEVEIPDTAWRVQH